MPALVAAGMSTLSTPIPKRADDAAARQLQRSFRRSLCVGGENGVGVARPPRELLREWALRPAQFRADFRQHLARRIEIRKHGIGNGNKFRRHQSIHPPHNTSDAIHGNRRTIRNAQRSIQHSQHHRDSALARERSHVRRTAAALGHHARHASQDVAQRGAGHAVSPKRRPARRARVRIRIASRRRGPRPSPRPRRGRSSADECSQTASGVAAGCMCSGRAWSNWNPAIVHRPFDFDRHAHQIFDAPQEPA